MIAARKSEYYGVPFQGYHGVNQGEPLPTHIFNVVVDVIFLHWVGLLVEKDAKPEGFGHSMMKKSTLFYADDGLVASTNLAWLQ